jgi:hypothetical protein
MAKENGDVQDVALEISKSYVLTLTYSPVSHQVTVGGESMPISLAQMIVGEASRLLEEQRRVASAQLLRQQLAQEQENARIAAAVRGQRPA